jgi:hypothetical protein
MSVYLDTITFIWAIIVLVIYSNWIVKKCSWLTAIGLAITAFYLVAQSGWTTAFILGDVWGRDLSNYVWFVFNTLVFTLLTVLWKKNRK